MTDFLTVPGGRIAYDVTGPAEGPLVVLVHGMGDTRRSFRFAVPRVAEAGYRVAAMDTRGYGESSDGWDDYSVAATAADILALIRHLGGPATVLGHSIAAASAVWAAAEAPDEVSALILEGGAAQRHQPPSALMKAAARLVSRSSRRWLRYYASLYPTAKPADFKAYKKDLRASLKGRTAPLRAQVDEAMEGRVPLRFDEVRARTLVVMGTKDRDFPDPVAEAQLAATKLVNANAKADVVLIEGAGHYAHAELPDRTVPAILEFLAGA